MKKILDGNAGTVNELIRRAELKTKRADKNPQIEFFYSGRRVTDSAETLRLQKFLNWLDDMEALT